MYRDKGYDTLQSSDWSICPPGVQKLAIIIIIQSSMFNDCILVCRIPRTRTSHPENNKVLLLMKSSSLRLNETTQVS